MLQAVRTDGDWEGWLEFFARAVRDVADQCTATAEKTNRLSRADRAKIQALGRIAGSVREITGKRRNRLFTYGELLDTMDEGTKPL